MLCLCTALKRLERLSDLHKQICDADLTLYPAQVVAVLQLKRGTVVSPDRVVVQCS